MRVAARLNRLERQTGAVRGNRCGTCGRLLAWRCGDAPDPAVKYVARFADARGPDDGPDQCPGCGRMRVYRMTFR